MNTEKIINRLNRNKGFMILGVTVNIILITLFVIGLSMVYGQEAYGEIGDPTCSPSPIYKDNTIVIVDPTSNCVMTYSGLGYEIKAVYNGMMYMQKVIK